MGDTHCPTLATSRVQEGVGQRIAQSVRFIDEAEAAFAKVEDDVPIAAYVRPR